jgi:pimeloyl-ACP methyl ester carboxylesterase
MPEFTRTLPNFPDMTLSGEVLGETSGENSPVLLLHGWGGSITSMRPVGELLAARGYTAHILDMPGFGGSTLPPEAWGAADYARFVAAYIDSIRDDIDHIRDSTSTENGNRSRVHLIGHSFGGRISLVLGADYAARVDKIVLTSSAGVRSEPTMRDSLVSFGKNMLKLPGLNRFEKGLRDWARDQFGSDDYKNAGALEPTFRKIIAEDLVPYAERIAAPTLLICGDADESTPLWQAKVLEKAIPDAGLVVFPGAGHFAYLERLPDFVRIVDTFFKGT